MGIQHTQENTFAKPKGTFLRNGPYVYINLTNEYVPPDQKQKKGTRGYTGHKSMCIGVLTEPKNPECTTFFANDQYRVRFLGVLPDPPVYADSICVGLTDWIGEAADQSGLTKILTDVFGEEAASMILDLAGYMLSKESAVMQHYPAWAREHAIFSDTIWSDTDIGQFLKKELTVSKIKSFREMWLILNLADGKIYLCYDSTNVNCQTHGVMIVQKGHAKDDPHLPQVNSDYVVRQQDGLPLTYLHSPGSVNDMAQAPEMIRFLHQAKQLSGKDVQMCMVCDRGYISEKNLRMMKEAGIEYILMLRTNFGLYEELANLAIKEIKTYKNQIDSKDGVEMYGITRECQVYKGGPTNYAQIYWSADRHANDRSKVIRRIDRERERVKELSSKKTTFYTQDELDAVLKGIPAYFQLQFVEGEPRQVEKKKRGRGKGTELVTVPTHAIVGFSEDEEGINLEIQKAGIMILITSEKMTCQEALDAYSKRDCVEKVFEALKSHLGMDKIGVTTEEAMHGKGLVWFVASILHALLFNGTTHLRATDRKSFTVPRMVDHLESIKGDKNLRTGKYERRYKLTHKQALILNPWKIDEQHIDHRIETLTDS